MADTAARYAANPAVAYTKIDDQEAVLLHMGSQRYFSLNETGVMIWELFAEPRSVNDVVAALAERYASERAALSDSVEEFVTELRRDDLIREI